MFEALARLADTRAKRVVGVAAIIFVAAAAIGGSVAKHLDPYGADDPATETVKARNLLEHSGYRETALVVLFNNADVSTPATRDRVESIERWLRQRSTVATVSGFYDTGSRAFVSHDGRSTYVAVSLRTTDDKVWQDSAKSIESQLAGRPGIVVGGPALAQEQVNKQTEKDLQVAEMFAFPLLFLLSLLFFRSVVASLLPLMIGGLAIVGTFLLLRVASELTSVSIFALNITTGLGLGLAIDYSLFVVSRYREEIAKDGPGLAAMRRTMATAGRTVFFSSLTVATAIASLLIFPQRFLYSMGLGGSLVALLAATVSLTVLPAVLTLLGTRVNSLAPSFLQRRAESDASVSEQGFWYRLSRLVMRRPIPIATLSAIVLLIAGIPFLGMKFTSVDAQILPESASARQVDDALRADFPPYHDTPIQIAVEGGGPKAAAQVRAEVRQVSGVAAVLPPRPLRGGVSLVQAESSTPYISVPAKDTVKRIRNLPEPAGSQVQVSGASADFVDLQSSLTRHLPIAVAIIVIATLVVLFLMTGSVVLPVKALLMNVLNLAAVLGILVWIFQDGRLQGFLSYTSQGALEQTMPILLAVVAFGLATDYAVFLLSRIKEARDHGASDSESVAIGLERTGRIVTAAAVLFAVAVGAFVTSQIIFIKEWGLGVALAVLIDASIIRALLVPSLMELLGKWNWWAPKPLRKLHDRLGFSEPSPEPPRPARQAAPEGT
jgi:uncharacterized membrane protein YdfJ with MMPL/SSD domain